MHCDTEQVTRIEDDVYELDSLPCWEASGLDATWEPESPRGSESLKRYVSRTLGLMEPFVATTVATVFLQITEEYLEGKIEEGWPRWKVRVKLFGTLLQALWFTVALKFKDAVGSSTPKETK